MKQKSVCLSKDIGREKRDGPAVFSYKLGDESVVKEIEKAPPSFLYPLGDSDALLIERIPHGYFNWEIVSRHDGEYFVLSMEERRESQKIRGSGVTVTPYEGLPKKYILDWHK